MAASSYLSTHARTGTTVAVLACVCLLFAAVSVQAAPRRRLHEAPSWHPRSATPKPRTPTGFGDESAPDAPYFKTDDEPSGGSGIGKSGSTSGDEETNTDNDDSSDDSSSSSSSSSSLDTGDATLLGPDMGRETLDAEQRAQSDRAKECDIIFASFFATKPGGFNRKKGERCNGCHEAPMFITFDSARLTNQGACTAVITDTDTEVDTSKPGMDKVMIHRFKGMDRTKIGTGGLMVERMKVYNAFVKRARDQGWRANLIMVDTDIVILGSVQELFDDTPDFDYGLSVRASAPYPVQGGVQYVRGGKYDGAAKFSDYVLRKWLEGLSGKEGGFTGDQRAYQEAVAPIKSIVAVAQKGKTHVMKVTPPGGESTGTELKVKLVPGDRFNFVPGGTGAGLKKADIRILHYKGGRKEGMFVPYNALKKGGIKSVYGLKKLN